MTPRGKIERRPLGEQVTGLVRRMIHEGELKAGERLVEEQLATDIGTSRTPIREALHRLEQENLVVRRVKGGYRVRPISAQEVREATGVRAALESYAVELAAGRLDPETLARLEANLESFAEALDKKDGKRLVKLNTDFHNMLYALAGSRLLGRLISELAETLHRFRVALLSDEQSARRALGDHRKMLAALKRGRTDEAVRICREHILAGGSWMLTQINEEQQHD